MSDNIKIVIEISKDTYAECQGHTYFPDTGEELFNAVKNGTPLDSDYDKLMTISQQLAFENEELRKNIEEIKEEIGDKYANTHHMYPDYAGGLSYAYAIIDKHIGKAESEE